MIYDKSIDVPVLIQRAVSRALPGLDLSSGDELVNDLLTYINALEIRVEDLENHIRE